MKRGKKNSLETVEGQVRQLLKKYPTTRNNDFYLTLLYLKYYHHLKCYGLDRRKGHELWIRAKDVERVTTVETIRRVRQKIQNVYHKYLPTDETVRKRRKRAVEAYRKYALKR